MRHQWSNIQELITMRGRPVYTSDGEKLGDFEEIYHDETTGQPEWLRVKSSILGGILGTKYFLVPLQGAEFQDGEDPAIRVPYSKDRVQDAPDTDDDGFLRKTSADSTIITAFSILSASLRPNSLRVKLENIISIRWASGGRNISIL